MPRKRMPNAQSEQSDVDEMQHSDENAAKKAKNEVVHDEKCSYKEEPCPDARTGCKYLRFVDPANLEMTAATQGFFQEDGSSPQVLHWGSNMYSEHDDEPMMQRMKLTSKEINKMKAGISADFECVENSNEKKFHYLAHRGPEITFVFEIPPKLSDEHGTQHGDRIRRTNNRRMVLLGQMVAYMQARSSNVPACLVVGTHYNEKTRALANSKASCWLTKGTREIFDEDEGAVDDAVENMANEDDHDDVCDQVSPVEMFFNFFPVKFDHVKFSCKEDGDNTLVSRSTVLVFASVYGVPGVNVEQFFQHFSQLTGRDVTKDFKDSDIMMSPKEIWTEMREHNKPSTGCNSTPGTQTLCLADDVDWFVKRNIDVNARDGVGRELGGDIIKKHWASAHENADCFEVRNVQIYGMAIPQDEMQLQKEQYALRSSQQRNLEWRQAHSSTARAAQDKRTRLPMMPRVPIRPPHGVPVDEQYFGNLEGIFTLRFKMDRLSKKRFGDMTAIGALQFPPAVQEALKRVEFQIDRIEDEPHSMYSATEREDRDMCEVQKLFNLRSETASINILKHERTVYTNRIMKSLQAMVDATTFHEVLAPINAVFAWDESLANHAATELICKLLEDVFFNSTQHEALSLALRFHQSMHSGSKRPQLLHYLERAGYHAQSNIEAGNDRTLDPLRQRHLQRPYLDGSRNCSNERWLNEFICCNEMVLHMRLQNMRNFCELINGIMGNLLVQGENFPVFGMTNYVVDMAGLWLVRCHEGGFRGRGKFFDVYYTRKAQSTGVDSMLLGGLRKFYAPYLACLAPFMNKSQAQTLNQNFGIRQLRRLTPLQHRSLGREIVQQIPGMDEVAMVTPIPREHNFRPTIMTDLAEVSADILMSLIDCQRRDSFSHLADQITTNQDAKNGRMQQRMRYVGGQETALIASNVQIKTQQMSDLQKTIRAANWKLPTGKMDTMDTGVTSRSGSNRKSVTNDVVSDVNTEKTRQMVVTLQMASDLTSHGLMSNYYVGLETIAINSGIQDAIAGGKTTMQSVFLNNLMEMPELSGDSIARTIDMALARLVVQNCNLNWFNLASSCVTVTELIKCNHLCMRYNSLEPVDVFSILYKGATQVLDMPLATMSLYMVHALKVPTPPQPEDFIQLFGAMQRGASLAQLPIHIRRYHEAVHQWLNERLAENSNCFSRSTTVTRLKRDFFISSPCNAEGRSIQETYDTTTMLENDNHAFRMEVSGAFGDHVAGMHIMKALTRKMTTLFQQSNIENRFENTEAMFDNVCKKKVCWQGMLFGNHEVTADVDINDAFNVLSCFGFSATCIKERFGVMKVKPSAYKTSMNAFRIDVLSSKRSAENMEMEHLITFSANVVHLLLFAAFFGNNKSFGADHIYNISEKMVQFIAGLHFSRHMMYPYGNSFPLRDLTTQADDQTQLCMRMIKVPPHNAYGSNTFCYRGRLHSSSSLLKTPMEPFMMEDLINSCEWIWHYAGLLQQMAGRSILDQWNKNRREKIDAHLIPSLLPNVQDRHVNIYDMFRLVKPSFIKTQPGLLFRTYYPWMQCRSDNASEDTQPQHGYLKVFRTQSSRRDVAEVASFDNNGNRVNVAHGPFVKVLIQMREEGKLLLPVVARPGAVVRNSSNSFGVLRYELHGDSQYKSCYNHILGCYEVIEIDAEGNVSSTFRRITPMDELLLELVPLQAELYLQVSDLLQMTHNHVNQENLHKLFHGTAMSLIFAKKTESVQQNILYGAQHVAEEDTFQASNMLNNMLVKTFLWYPEFDKEADICASLFGVVVLFHVYYEKSNTVIPEKCVVPVHLLTRGFDAKHFHDARSSAQQPRTVCVERLYCKGADECLLTCNIVTP